MPDSDRSEPERGYRATVVRTEANRVLVEIVPGGCCADCRLVGGCAGLRLTSTPRRLAVEAFSGGGAAPGDTVELRLPRGGIALSAVLLYLLPAAAVVGGAAVGSGPGAEILHCSQDVGAMTGAGVALLAVLGILGLVDSSVSGWRRLRLDAVTDRASERVS